MTSNIKLHRLLLNREHVDQYALPRTPIKESELRAASFEARPGEGAVELDSLEALHPGVLASIVSTAPSRYYSPQAEQSARAKEVALRQAIRKGVAAITARYSEHIDALQGMNEELSELEVPNLEDYEPATFPPTAGEQDLTWLFASERDYLSQIAAYKAYARGNGGAAAASAGTRPDRVAGYRFDTVAQRAPVEGSLQTD